MRHMNSGERPICALTSSNELIGSLTRSIYGQIDCEACLRRAIAEGEERARVLRALLEDVEAAPCPRVLTGAGDAQGALDLDDRSCKQSHYAAIVDALKDVEIYQLGDADCPDCLRRMIDKHAALTATFQGLLSEVVFAKGPDLVARRALCHECSEMVEVIAGKLAPHHGASGDGCPLNGAVAQICLHPRVADRIAELEAALAFGPGGSR